MISYEDMARVLNEAVAHEAAAPGTVERYETHGTLQALAAELFVPAVRELAMARADVDRLTKERDAALALLRRLEWSGTCAYDESAECPACFSDLEETTTITRAGEPPRSAAAGRHFDDCPLAALIAKP